VTLCILIYQISIRLILWIEICSMGVVMHIGKVGPSQRLKAETLVVLKFREAVDKMLSKKLVDFFKSQGCGMTTQALIMSWSFIV
uniref:hypothetical protein n=1 Tax=Pseudomonas viridiflava TaxID=33069 RepID=UPI001F151290